MYLRLKTLVDSSFGRTATEFLELVVTVSISKATAARYIRSACRK